MIWMDLGLAELDYKDPTAVSSLCSDLCSCFCVPVYAMVSAAHPDLQLVSLSRVFGLSSLCSTAEVAVISLLGSTP